MTVTAPTEHLLKEIYLYAQIAELEERLADKDGGSSGPEEAQYFGNQ